MSIKRKKIEKSIFHQKGYCDYCKKEVWWDKHICAKVKYIVKPQPIEKECKCVLGEIGVCPDCEDKDCSPVSKEKCECHRMGFHYHKFCVDSCACSSLPSTKGWGRTDLDWEIENILTSHILGDRSAYAIEKADVIKRDELKTLFKDLLAEEKAKSRREHENKDPKTVIKPQIDAIRQAVRREVIEEIKNAPLEMLQFHDMKMKNATFVKKKDLLKLLTLLGDK